MSIRQEWSYDSKTKTRSGGVDLGNGSPESDDTSNLASEAMVFMITGLKFSWKAPIAYFFTRTLSAATLAQLVEHSLRTLYEQGFLVHCLTMDGHQSNVAMARILGAQTDAGKQLIPYFQLSGQDHRTYILFDPCHMIKLARNMLHDVGAFKSPDGVVRRTCISGLVVGIDAVIGLSEQLLTTGQMQFLLMYKFSQDHLELFFNAVRRFGGWNNNPSVNHFKAAFRALIS
ncbi:hypothetical protein CAPTEDRAFT_185073, partial [Capitella teleta]